MKDKQTKQAVAQLLLQKGYSFAEIHRILRDIFGTSISNNTLHQFFNQEIDANACKAIIQTAIQDIDIDIQAARVHLARWKQLLEHTNGM